MRRQLEQFFTEMLALVFSVMFSFCNSLTLNKLRQRQMLEEKLSERRRRRMEQLEKRQIDETKVLLQLTYNNLHLVILYCGKTAPSLIMFGG